MAVCALQSLARGHHASWQSDALYRIGIISLCWRLTTALMPGVDLGATMLCVALVWMR